MSLKAEINNAMKDAMRAKDKPRLGAIRLIQAEVKRVEVDERIEIDDQRLVAIMDKMVKQRRDSITQYEAAGRDELAAIEIAEIKVIQDFLPTALSAQEVVELERLGRPRLLFLLLRALARALFELLVLLATRLAAASAHDEAEDEG